MVANSEEWMVEDWTVDIPLKTPSNRQASKDKVETTGSVLGKPATLTTHGSGIRLKVSGFESNIAANEACPSLCFGVRYMSLSIPIAVEFDNTPQKVASARDPRAAALNVSASFGGADFGKELHGIMYDGAPAIYLTGQNITMISGHDVNFIISGIGKTGEALKWIDAGANQYSAVSTVDEEVDIALELFNLAGFEPSPRAAFIVHYTALEQLFPPLQVDATLPSYKVKR